MNMEDYSKYYIQGSDHYLIPKDIFKELFNEMINWKEESKQLKDNWNNLREYFNERIEVWNNILSSPFCNFERATKERLIYSQCLEKLEELEQGSDE